MKSKLRVAGEHQLSIAATVAGEDIRRGDYVALLNVVTEMPTFFWDSQPTEDLVRLKFIPNDAGIPHRVQVVCLPFVYTKSPSGILRTIDLRLSQVVRLDRKAARKVWKAMTPPPLNL